MGRALFSHHHHVVQVVHPDSAQHCPEKWSPWNYFDPDSDEFFENAERELFTDTEEYRRQEEEEQRERPQHVRVSDIVVGEAGMDSSASSESEDSSEHGSITESSPDWRHRVLVAGQEWHRQSSHRTQNELPHPATMNFLRDPATTTTVEHARSRPRAVSLSHAHLPNSPLRHSSIPALPSSSFRQFAATPSTPHPVSISPYLSPSPPPSVSPNIYTWNRRPLPVPTSPLAAQTAMGMLNPDARVSRANVTVHLQNADI